MRGHPVGLGMGAAGSEQDVKIKAIMAKAIRKLLLINMPMVLYWDKYFNFILDANAFRSQFAFNLLDPLHPHRLPQSQISHG